ncbi:MAG: spermidine/putrescine ABC transporter permease [Anaerolineae bacterium]|nr:MAG: spermidine/putrescine ABC transporter permease [Anaerolineae bacterium]WKZ45338.1 MAG: ABC transporter permease subunit [Anaerolineales bacterium]WKZ47946.1 MAG: ABC transporter permease subunit [Anaerolineales bacterium]
MSFLARLRKFPFWAWLWFIIGGLYFILPLLATVEFSLSWDPEAPFKAYQRAFEDNRFWSSFIASNVFAVITIIASIILVVPTAYWIRLRLPQARRIVEFITLMPFVVPAIILVFGMIRVYSTPFTIPFTDVVFMRPFTQSRLGTDILIVAGYMVLSMPYMYRSVDTGMRTVDILTLTEAAQSLGANWFAIITRIILPNIRSALLSGALLTFAIVVGEVILASYLGVTAFGPYLFLLGQHRAYEPAALSFVSFLLTWLAMGLIQLFTGGQGQAAGAH